MARKEWVLPHPRRTVVGLPDVAARPCHTQLLGPLLASMPVSWGRSGDREVVTNTHFFSHLNPGEKAVQHALPSSRAPSQFKRETFGTMNSSSCSYTSRRLIDNRRALNSLTKLGRLSTLTSESNWEGLRSSACFPLLRVPTHKQVRLQNQSKAEKGKTQIFDTRPIARLVFTGNSRSMGSLVYPQAVNNSTLP